MEFLERLRKQPQHVRSRVALGSAVAVTAFIGLIWSTTLPARLSTIGGTIETEGLTQTGSLQGGFDSILQTMGEDLETVMDESPEEEIGIEESSIDTTSSSMSGLEGWENGSAGVQGESEPVSSLESEEEAPSKDTKVILIGTTPKKSE